jgi:hypothetical protein
VSGNGGGGGAAFIYSNLDSANTTVTNNSGDGVHADADAFVGVSQTIVSGNTGVEVSLRQNEFLRGGLGVYFNLFGHSGRTNAEAFDNFRPAPSDITATSDGDSPTALADILNTNLANNGSTTRTHALPARSPAVDAVDNDTCPTAPRDQRGVRRPQDGNSDGGIACDIGSFQRQ